MTRNKTVALALVTIVAFLFSSFVAAAKPEIYSHKRKGAVKGIDVVAYFSLEPGAKAVKGDKKITYDYKDATFRFATEENRALFVKNPEKYIPQYGGYCAFAVSKNFTTSIRPDSWTIVDGKLYLNHNSASRKYWRKDRDKKIALADANWPAVLSK